MKQVWIYISLMITAMTLAVACGKKDDGGGSSGPTTAATPTSCPAGQLFDSRYGCLTQGSCATGSGMYNNQCIVVQVSNINGAAQNCTAGLVYSTTRSSCLPQGSCGFGYALYNNQCEYAGTNNGVNYQNNQYNGYQYQNGYFYPQNNGGYNGYNNGYNGGYYGNQYNNGYNGGYNNGGYNNGWGLRGGVWFRYY